MTFGLAPAISLKRLLQSPFTLHAGVLERIRRETDPVIDKIVAGWPRNFNPQRALALGFKAEANFEEIIRVHIEDELHGTFVK